MSTFCPICGDPLTRERHDCPAARPRPGRPVARVPLQASPAIARARVGGIDPPAPTARPARPSGNGGAQGQA